MTVGALRPFRHRLFRLTWAASLVSTVGDGITLIAFPILALRVDTSVTSVGWVSGAQGVGTLASLLVGGTLSDRLSRIWIMICSDLVRMAAVGAVAALALWDEVAVWRLIVLALVAGLASGLFVPAAQAVVPDIVPRGELAAANSLGELAKPLGARVVGASIAGFLIAGLGIASCFAIDAASFAVSAWLLTRVAAGLPRAPGAVPTSDNADGLLADLRAGIRLVRATPWLFTTILGAGCAVFFSYGSSQVLVPYVVQEVRGDGASALGAVFACGGLGAFAGALAASVLVVRWRSSSLVLAVWGVGTLVTGFYGVVNTFGLFPLVAATSGFVAVLGNVMWVTMVQERVPADYLGRTFALDAVVVMSAIPLSAACVTVMSGAAGPRSTMLACGVAGSISMCLCVLGLRLVESRGRMQEVQLN